MERRLAAILAADVAGYSRMMGDDENGTHRILTADLRQIVRVAIAAQGGRIERIAGDGILAEFATATGAVRAARAIQTGMAQRNAGRRPGRQIRFRIGINFGQIGFDGESIFGDGVNIAARLEAQARPGEILASAAVREAVGTDLRQAFTDRGSFELKNIRAPVAVCSIGHAAQGWLPPARPARRPLRRRLATLAGAATVVAALMASQLLPPAPQMTAQPSVAVLPFRVLGDGGEATIVAAGIERDVVSDLGKFRALLVLPPASMPDGVAADDPEMPGRVLARTGARYVLVTSVEDIGDRIRVDVRLLDTVTGATVWSGRYDRPETDPVAAQGEITDAIVSAIAPAASARGVFGPLERLRLSKVPSDSLQGYDHFWQGVALARIGDARAFRDARAAFERAVAIDPLFARAHAQIAWTHLAEYGAGWAADPVLSLSLAEAAAGRAVDADPTDSDAVAALATVRLYQGQRERALSLYREAHHLNPNDADVAMRLGWALALGGAPDEALTLMQPAVARTPDPPGWYHEAICLAEYLRGRPDAAASALAASPRPTAPARLILAASYAELGQTAASRQQLRLIRLTTPRYDTAALARSFPVGDAPGRLTATLSPFGLLTH